MTKPLNSARKRDTHDSNDGDARQHADDRVAANRLEPEWERLCDLATD